MPMMNELLRDLKEDPPGSEGELRSLLDEHGYDLVAKPGYDSEDDEDDDTEEDEDEGEEYDGMPKSVFGNDKSPRANLALIRITAARNAQGKEA